MALGRVGGEGRGDKKEEVQSTVKKMPALDQPELDSVGWWEIPMPFYHFRWSLANNNTISMSA